MGRPKLAGVGALPASARTVIDLHAWGLFGVHDPVLLRKQLRPAPKKLHGAIITRGTDALRMHCRALAEPEVEAAKAAILW